MTTPLSAAIRKSVQSLAATKGRRAQRAFVAEGTRCVLDSLPHFALHQLFATPQWISEHPSCENVATAVSQSDIQRISLQQSPQPVIAVFELPEIRPFEYNPQEMTLALDCVQDPGNLGTIIRLADWFGIRHILAAPGTADPFAPKVVQATMGALARVEVHRVEDLAETLRSVAAPVIGTLLDGRDLYRSEVSLTPRPIIVMGNEGNGISPQVRACLTDAVRIPSFPPGVSTSESLNVAVATSIIVSELSRRIYG